jgi:ATP-binding cassette subfamily G (WHITE) protein 2 (SNQ2)
MLEVVGAGATAVAEKNWYEVWLSSKERDKLDEELEHIHIEGRKQPPVPRTLQGTFATPWMFQTKTLLRRQYASYWRNPTYLMSKLVLNIVGGLFIGFTFFKSGNSIQANQDKLFVSINVIDGGLITHHQTFSPSSWALCWYVLIWES